MVPLIRDYGCCDPNSLAYVNRLSDYLFTAARFVNYCDGKDEVQYRRERGLKSSEIGGRERVVVRLKD
jgi:cob(I)alamin adenosyltransferase